MMKKTFAFALVLAAVAFAPMTAEARGFRVGFGAKVKIGGHVRVSVGAPVVVHPGHQSYYGCDTTYYRGYYASYYAPGPAPAPAPAPYVYAEPRRPSFGLGLYASSLELEEGGAQAEGGGLLARFRLSPRLELEAQLGGDAFVDSSRQDARFGAALLVNLGQPGGFTPYALVGAGANVVNRDPENTPEDAVLPTYGYVEAGLGLSWEITPNIAITGDVRFQSRKLAEDDDPEYRIQVAGMPDEEHASEVRISGIYYF